MDTDPIEADSMDVWQLKPWWCQPWSIVLTATGIPTLSWLVFHRFWLTGLIALPFLVWMTFFIWIYPRLVQENSASLELHDR